MAVFGSSESLYRLLVESASEVIFVLDHEGVIRYATPSVAGVLGFTAEEVRGRRIGQFIHPDNQPVSDEVLRAAWERGEAYSGATWRLRSKEGAWRRCEMRVAQPSGSQPPAVLVVNCRDVTRREEAIEEAHRSGRYLEQLLDTAPVAITLLDQEDRVVRVNSEFTRIFGYAGQKLVGLPINDLIVPPDRRAEAETLTQRVANGERVSTETVRQRADGAAVDVSILASPIHVAGKQAGIFGVYRDITEWKRLETHRAELLERERQARIRAEAAERRTSFLAEVSTVLDSSLDYRTAFHNLARLVVPTLADYCLIDELEGEMLQRVAFSHRDPRRESLLEANVRHPTDVDPERHPVVLAITGGEPILVAAVTPELLAEMAHDEAYKSRYQELGIGSFMIVPLLARGRTLGAITLVSAESGRRYGVADLALAEEVAHRAAVAIDNARLYSDAQEAIQARQRVLGFVSHDLRNPLATILLNVSSILETRGPADLAPELREQLEWVERSTSQMNRLIDDLLDIVRIEAGHLSVEQAAVPLALLFAEAVAMCRAQALEAEIDLRAEPPPEALLVHADRQRILQVFSNLISNALKFTDRGGEVRICAQSDPEDDTVTVSVADTGVGISSEHLPRLFDRFWQAKRSGRGGTGLGLAIARGIVAAHGGKIWVESEPGDGSSFRFTLPTIPSE